MFTPPRLAAGLIVILLTACGNDIDWAQPGSVDTPGPGSSEEFDTEVRVHWESDRDDIDLHLVNTSTAATPLFDPDGDCHFKNCVSNRPEWGAPGYDGNPLLDKNDRSYGPEIIRVAPSSEAARYTVSVHFWNGQSTDVRVEVDLHLPNGETVHFSDWRHLDSQGDTWHVAEIEWPPATIVGIDTLRRCSPDDVKNGGTCP